MFGAHRAAPFIGDAAHHLHETVESPAPRPWSRRAVGREPADDESGSQREQSLRGIAETAQGSGPITVDDHIRGRDEALEGSPPRGVPQIEQRAPLAEATVDGNGRILVEARRVDT